MRDGKGGKNWLMLLPQSLVAGLQEHLLKVRHLHQSDVAAGWVVTISIRACLIRLNSDCCRIRRGQSKLPYFPLFIYYAYDAMDPGYPNGSGLKVLSANERVHERESLHIVNCVDSPLIFINFPHPLLRA